MHQMRISTNQVSSVMLRWKKLSIRKKRERADKKNPSIIKLSQIRQKDRAMP
jgi:hypothetical protein